MSCSVVLQTTVKQERHLSRACDRMRDAGFKVEGPTVQEAFYRPNSLGNRRAHLVKLPSWHGNIAFYCDQSGETYHDSDHAGERGVYNRLIQEAAVAAAEAEVAPYNGHIGNLTIDPTTGLMRIEIDIPEVTFA